MQIFSGSMLYLKLFDEIDYNMILEDSLELETPRTQVREDSVLLKGKLGTTAGACSHRSLGDWDRGIVWAQEFPSSLGNVGT